MALFRNKCENEEYLQMNCFIDFINDLLKKDEFISKSMYMNQFEEITPLFNEFISLRNKNVLDSYCKKQKINFRKMVALIDYFSSFNDFIVRHNDSYVNNHLISDKVYLDNVLKDDDPNISLDEEQRRVVLSDEDYTLVVAGAGAGKTTTIEAKVKYLVDIKHIDPEQILIVSFTRKATKELKDRINKRLKTNACISTFHSIGNTIIKNEEENKYRIVDVGFMFDAIKNYLVNKLDDEYFINKIVLFFSSYLNISFSSKDTSLLFKELNKNNFVTLRSDLENIIERYKGELDKKRITLNDERVRSNDELRIANFLYINGIDYEYEPVYRFGFKRSIKPYCPDFLLRQGDKEVYLEHFGLSEDGKNSRFTKEEIEKYKEEANNKIRLHKEHNTKLIYTYSRYNDGRDLIVHLEELLIANGFTFNKKTTLEIYKKISSSSQDKYFNKFVQLMCNFISRFKVNNFKESKFDEWKITVNDERTKLFIDIAYQCYLAYTKELKDKGCIDFSDMINDASDILDKYILSGQKLPYEYIFVDEYQDISIQRFDLCEKLSKCSNAKIVAVGDDWQSIFRFAGSKLDLFTSFQEKMTYGQVLKLTNTYRNAQELIDIAGDFVMQNKQQIQKELKSPKHIEDPVLLMSYDDSFDKEERKGPYYRLCEALEKAIGDIVLKCGEEKSILLIGRYGFDIRNLARVGEMFYLDNTSSSNVKSVKYPNVSLSGYTAHSSKGLGFDNVIILNGKDDVIGFPSKIEDDPVMKLVIKEDENIAYAEERRLFYVALTRTKNRVYIITPISHPSKFILEIREKFTNVILKGKELAPIDTLDLRRKCPICGYPLQYRTKIGFGLKVDKLWICSNDPELCGFLTNDLSGGKMSISKCPRCEDGYLVVKSIKGENGVDTGQRMLGCTNYTPDKKGCNFALASSNFTQNRDDLNANYMQQNIDIDKLIVFDRPIKELINIIIKILKDTEHILYPYSFSIFSLSKFLCGNEDKGIKQFKVKEKIDYFGIIDKKYESRVKKFINALKEFEIIDINKDDYYHITLMKQEISDSLCVDVYRRFSATTTKNNNW